MIAAEKGDPDDEAKPAHVVEVPISGHWEAGERSGLALFAPVSCQLL